MRKVMVFVLVAALLVGVSYAFAQESTTPKPGDQPSIMTGPGSSSMTGPGAVDYPKLMQQMQDTMQQMQDQIRKSKTTSADMKRMQDMVNQMQSMMNQMQISHMMQMMGSCPMMKPGQQPSSMSPSSPPQTPSGQSEMEKKP